MAILTADGRDITKEEWRVVPGFSRYKITKDGDVYSRSRGTLLKESYNHINGNYSYTVYSDENRSTSRHFQSLVDLAFPELKDPNKVAAVKAPTYLSKEHWRDIPGFSKYQLHSNGRVRYASQRRLLKFKTNSITGLSYVSLRNDQEEWPLSLDDLMEMVFPDIQKEEKKVA